VVAPQCRGATTRFATHHKPRRPIRAVSGTADDIGWGPAIGAGICSVVFFVPAVVILIRRLRRR